MGWALVNIVMKDRDDIEGRNAALRDLIKQVHDDGYIPWRMTGVPGVGLVLSLRKETHEAQCPIGDVFPVGFQPPT
jgi:hypothetical protein